MIDKNCWRQAVPVDVFYGDSTFTAIDRAVFFELLLRAQRCDETIRVRSGNTYLTLHLKRGQVFFRVAEYAMDTGLTRSRIRSALNFIHQSYTRLNITEYKRKGLLIHMIDYDELVSFDTRNDINSTPERHHSDTTATSLYRNKTERRVRPKESNPREKKDFSDENPFYPAKHWKTWEDVPDKVIEEYDERYTLEKRLWVLDLKHDPNNLRKMIFNYFAEHKHESLTI